MRKIWYTPPPKDNRLGIFNGVRCLSIFWGMLGHSWSIAINAPATNILTLQEDVSYSWFYPFVSGVIYAVVTFFSLSAFLGALLMLEKFYKKRGLPFAYIYIHRIYRLLPSIMMVVLFMIVVFEMLGSGPAWSSYAGDMARACEKRWWAKMLFIGEWLH